MTPTLQFNDLDKESIMFYVENVSEALLDRGTGDALENNFKVMDRER